jgi:hypothetical protein
MAWDIITGGGGAVPSPPPGPPGAPGAPGPAYDLLYKIDEHEDVDGSPFEVPIVDGSNPDWLGVADKNIQFRYTATILNKTKGQWIGVAGYCLWEAGYLLSQGTTMLDTANSIIPLDLSGGLINDSAVAWAGDGGGTSPPVLIVTPLSGDLEDLWSVEARVWIESSIDRF